MPNISTPLESGILTLTQRGLESKTSTINTGSFTFVSSGSDIIYPYEFSTNLISNISSSFQSHSIVWINYGEDKDKGNSGDGRLHWNLLDYQYISQITGSGSITRYKISAFDSIPLPNIDKSENTTIGYEYSYIFNIRDYIATGSLYYQYNEYVFHTVNDHTMIINGVDVTALPANSRQSIIFTIPGYGSYAFGISGSTIEYDMANNRSTLSFRENTRYKYTSIKDYVTSSFNNGDKFNDGYVLFTSKSVFENLTDTTLAGTLIRTPITASVYLNSQLIKEGEISCSFFDVSGDQRNRFKPGTIISVNGNTMMVNGYKYEGQSEYLYDTTTTPPGEVTRVHAISYPFTGSLYSPPNLILGMKTYPIGFNTVAANGTQLVLGTYNTTSNYDKIFVIGNGISNSDRSDLLTVSRNAMVLSGSLTTVGNVLITGSLGISGTTTINNILALPPVHPLPSNQPTGSIASSGSGANCKLYFFNGTWNALF